MVIVNTYADGKFLITSKIEKLATNLKKTYEHADLNKKIYRTSFNIILIIIVYRINLKTIIILNGQKVQLYVSNVGFYDYIKKLTLLLIFVICHDISVLICSLFISRAVSL